MLLTNYKNTFDPLNNTKHMSLFKRDIKCFLTLPEICEFNDLKNVHGLPEEINSCFSKYSNYNSSTKKLQMSSTVEDFPAFFRNLVREFENMKAWDNGYIEIFDEMPSNQDDVYEVYDTYADYEYERIQPGGSISYAGGYGENRQVPLYIYGAGAGIDRRLIKTRKFFLIEKQLTALRIGAQRKKALVYYGLIDAIGAGINQSWQTHPDGITSGTEGYTAGRDAQTINKSIIDIIDDCKDKGYGDLMGETFIILAPFQLEDRINRALDFTPRNNSNRLVTRSIKVILTTHLTDTSKYYTILPKRNITRSDLFKDESFDDFNKTNYMHEFANWLGFGGDIADEDQFKRCATS